jgi:hypothetical protein
MSRITTSATDEQRIRGGLRFLTKADDATIRAAVHLQRLEGTPNPAGVGELLEEFSFDVDGERFSGWMTQAQYDYLGGQTGNLCEFADAIAKVLVGINSKVLRALSDLSGVINTAPAAAALADGQGECPAPLGCCTYDSTRDPGITQAFCEGGLQGTWVAGDCTQCD